MKKKEIEWEIEGMKKRIKERRKKERLILTGVFSIAVVVCYGIWQYFK